MIQWEGAVSEAMRLALCFASNYAVMWQFCYSAKP